MTLAHQRQRGDGSDPGGRQQQDEADQGQGREGGRRLVQGRDVRARQRARAD
jgi:hypothetical protein